MRVLNDSSPTVGGGGADASSSAPPLLVTPAAAAGMVGEVQLQPAAAAGSGGAGSSDAGFDADMVIILAALLCVLVCALGLNSLFHHCFVLDFGRTTMAAAPAPATAAGAAAATGSGTAGLKKRELKRIPVVVYEAAKPGASSATTDCAICLGEFHDGERVRVLPRCHHGFHVQCIDLWLATHPSCPTCRNSLLIQQQGRRLTDDGDGDGDGEATTTVVAREEQET